MTHLDDEKQEKELHLCRLERIKSKETLTVSEVLVLIPFTRLDVEVVFHPQKTAATEIFQFLVNGMITTIQLQMVVAHMSQDTMIA